MRTRADARRQILADHAWTVVQTEARQNEELLAVTKQLLERTQQVHALTTRSTTRSPRTTHRRRSEQPDR